MAGLFGTTLQPDLTPVAAEAGAVGGDPRPVYTWAGPHERDLSLVGSYTPSDGEAPRLVAAVGGGVFLDVWDTETGASVRGLQGRQGGLKFRCLLTYQRPSDGRPRIAAGAERGHLSIWDGDDLALAHHIVAGYEGRPVRCLAVYEEPISERTRLVSA
jgi:WD40 repeat protein